MSLPEWLLTIGSLDSDDRDAFREAIINAFCHRDYSEYDSVNIAIFKDRLEIRNSGNFTWNLTDLLRYSKIL